VKRVQEDDDVGEHEHKTCDDGCDYDLRPTNLLRRAVTSAVAQNESTSKSSLSMMTPWSPYGR